MKGKTDTGTRSYGGQIIIVLLNFIRIGVGLDYKQCESNGMMKDESMLLPMHREAITERKGITPIMREIVLPRFGGYHIYGFTCMVDVLCC
jgi:hypothetical protein